MRAFQFHAPTSLPEAWGLLQEWGPRAKLLAGGTDLLLQIRAGDRSPEAIISLKRLAELRGIQRTADQGLRLGAYTTLRELTRSAEVQQLYPCLAHTASIMASEPIRALATLGGNLCNGSPSADLAPPLIAMDTQAWIAGPQGERRVLLQDFFIGPGITALSADEILLAVELPPSQGQTTYIKHAPRAYMDIAIVGVAASLSALDGTVDRARIVLGAVAPIPLRAERAEEALVGAEISPERFERAAELAAAASSPISDTRGSEWYRRRMVRVLVRRALEAISPDGTGA